MTRKLTKLEKKKARKEAKRLYMKRKAQELSPRKRKKLNEKRIKKRKRSRRKREREDPAAEEARRKRERKLKNKRRGEQKREREKRARASAVSVRTVTRRTRGIQFADAVIPKNASWGSAHKGTFISFFPIRLSEMCPVAVVRVWTTVSPWQRGRRAASL